MRQAIVTKFLGPANSRGSRVKATAAAGSVTVDWDYAVNSDMNHLKAAMALAHKQGWVGEGFRGTWVAGGLPSEAGNVFVYTGEGNDPSGWPLGSAFEV